MYLPRAGDTTTEAPGGLEDQINIYIYKINKYIYIYINGENRDLNRC